VSDARIRIMATSTDKVPNTSATAASSGSDLNGQAVKAACETLRARLQPVAASMLGGEPEEVRFADDSVFLDRADSARLDFADVVHAAYNARISHPFYYYAFGAAAAEVEVCGFTGVHNLRRVDLLHDVGDSLAEGIDRGQIEGGFVQGLGWLTCEELRWNSAGRLLTDAPSTYKIPTLGEVPQDFRVSLFRRSRAASTDVIFGSKGVGEPPLMLALSVREALRDAVAAFATTPGVVALASPATPEAVFQAIERVRSASPATVSTAATADA
jgi:xanthine dehydrogenase large subunit